MLIKVKLLRIVHFERFSFRAHVDIWNWLKNSSTNDPIDDNRTTSMFAILVK